MLTQVVTVPTGYFAQIEATMPPEPDDAVGRPYRVVVWRCDHRHEDYKEAEACGLAEVARRYPELRAAAPPPTFPPASREQVGQ